MNLACVILIMTIKLVEMTIILGGVFVSNSIESNGSRKEEILARSRQSNKDEGMEHAEIKGFKLGERIGSVVAMI